MFIVENIYVSEEDFFNYFGVLTFKVILYRHKKNEFLVMHLLIRVGTIVAVTNKMQDIVIVISNSSR